MLSMFHFLFLFTDTTDCAVRIEHPTTNVVPRSSSTAFLVVPPTFFAAAVLCASVLEGK